MLGCRATCLLMAFYVGAYGAPSAGFHAQPKNLSVLVFGDSWGALDPNWHALQAMFDRHGVAATVKSSAISGTRACQWAEDPNSLKDKAAKLFPDSGPDFVWYTLGGNDLESKYYRACSQSSATFEESIKCLATATAHITNCSQSMLSPFLEAYPAAKVMQCGYDVSCVQGRCAEIAAQRAPFCHKNGLNISCDVEFAMAWQPLLLTPLAKKFPNHYTGINILGAVQQAFGIPDAKLGRPSLSELPPCTQYKYCVHPQNKAATAVTEAFWDLFYSKELRHYY